MSSRTYRSALAEAMRLALESPRPSAIIGQGVTDHKGIFGTTMGLADDFPGRVLDTPLAEDSIAGICIGMALNGVYPINTHIRADFGLLTFNQLINLAAKYRYMFGGLFEVPMMMRWVIGRSWGQGAQHSQSLQSLVAHIPGLVVVMPATPQAVLASYKYAFEEHRGPVVMLEHRLLYEIEFNDSEAPASHPIFGSRLDREGIDVTVIATSVMVLEARRAADHLAEFGVSVEIIDLHSVSHYDSRMILASVKKTGRLLVADTSWEAYGVGAEMARLVASADPSLLKVPLKTLGMAPASCPTAKSLEDIFYPDLNELTRAILSIMGRTDVPDSSLPRAGSMVDFYKHFKGPF
jgi:acetoin:2,6-dichlorophenolindophenol oxidoreductase subunit beta